MAGLAAVSAAHATLSQMIEITFPARHQFLRYPAALDSLPSGTVVLNVQHRRFNLAAFGKGFHNMVVGIIEVRRRFSNGVRSFRFDEAGLRALHASYLLAAADDHLEAGPCVSLTEIGRTEVDPFSGHDLADGTILLKISYCDDD